MRTEAPIQTTLEHINWHKLNNCKLPFNISGIYIIRYNDSNRLYVGSSTSIRRRSKEHCYALRKRTRTNIKLAYVYDKYGIDAFEIGLLEEETSILNMRTRETFWIGELDTFKNGLNEAPSSNGAGRIISEFTRKKIGLASKGRIASDHTRKLISIAAKNRSPESILAGAMKKRGRPRSIEAINKTAAAHRGMKRDKSMGLKIGKKTAKLSADQCVQIDSLITEGRTYKVIAALFNVSPQTICNVRNRAGVVYKQDTPPPELNVYNTQESKDKRRQAQLGKKVSDATKLKMSLNRRGRPKSVEHRLSISRALRIFRDNKKRAIEEIERNENGTGP